MDLDFFLLKGKPKKNWLTRWAWDRQPLAPRVSVDNIGGKPLRPNTFRNVYAVFFFLIYRKK